MIYNNCKILFIGTVEFSHRALTTLIENKFQVIGILTKEESNFNSDFRDLSSIAKENNIPVFYRTKTNLDEIISFINSKNPDVIYCFGWSHILPKKILSIPKYGVIGFHPAELPNNKGRHPIIWALFLGLKQTASTFFVMDEGADTGDIISQEIILIDGDDAFSLYNKVINVAQKQIVKFTLQLESKGEFLKILKQDNSKGNSWRKRTKYDGIIDFRMTSKAIFNLVNALSRPYVGASLEFQGKEVKIWKVIVEKFNKSNLEPGKVLNIDGNDIIVKTYDGSIRITDHDFKQLPLKGQYL